MHTPLNIKGYTGHITHSEPLSEEQIEALKQLAEMAMEREKAKRTNPYQCPVCSGRGKVQSGFYGDMTSSTPIPYEDCRSCKGLGVLWQETLPFENLSMDFLPVLEENYQAQLRARDNNDPSMTLYARKVLIKEYEDLIAIYKSKTA